MKNICTISGGKDSQAVAIWMPNNGVKDFDFVFCNTGWEAPETYSFLNELEEKTSKKIITLQSKLYSDLPDLAKKKTRFPSTKRRFCTSKLKVEPMIDFILDRINCNVNIYQGIRHEESRNRASLNRNDDYFKFYFEPYRYDKKGKPVFHTYRKKEVFEFCENYSANVIRPIITWSTVDVFRYIKQNGFSWNPLYDLGLNRVGCFPCIQCNHNEILTIAQERPEIITKIRKLEIELDSTFFPIGYIPERFCTKKTTTKEGELKRVPTIDDIVNYLKSKRGATNLFSQSTCKNNYVVCE